MRKIGRFYVLSSMLYLPPGSAHEIERFEDIEATNSQESGVETHDSGLPTDFIDYGPGDS